MGQIRGEGMRYTKGDVKKHGDGRGYAPWGPAVNVKTYAYGNGNVKAVQKHFNCTEEVAEKACNFAFESEQEQFWEYWQDKTGDLENGLHGSPEYAYFPGYDVTIEQGGRSGGWLEVSGLPDIAEWDAILLMRWRRFELAVLDDVKYRCSIEAWIEGIEANDWAEKGAERHNHVDTPGGIRKVSDLNAVIIDVTRRFQAGEPFVPTLFWSGDKSASPRDRLEYLRGELERISCEDLSELRGLIPFIEPGDVQLLEAAEVPE
jgi:hypothetical protein